MKKEEARQRLQAEKARLQTLIDHQREAVASPAEAFELSSVDQHQAELGTETFERERDQATALILEGELKEVDDGLRRLDQGGYARCEECGQAIGEERLEAKPWARYCIEDQARIEREVAARRR